MGELNRGESALGPYRVLDLADEKGMLCARLLGDLGADVIKVERPGGDAGRNIGPFYHDIPHPEKSLYWFAFNSNKRGITLSIETGDGQELFKGLVQTADFVVESFTPGYLDGLGLGYAALSQINPRLVMTSITPFGQEGPKAHHKASDLTCWASGGAMYVCGDPDRPPLQVSFPQSYLHASVQAAVGTLLAHYHREMTGGGQHVDVSIQEAVMGTLQNTQEMWDLNRFNCPRVGYNWVIAGIESRLRLSFRCKDGEVTLLTLVVPPGVVSNQALVRWMDEEGWDVEWLKDFDWVHQYGAAALTKDLVDKVEGVFADFLKTKTKKELCEAALKRRIMLAPLYDTRDVWEDDHLRARGFWVEMEHPELGETLTYCGDFAKLSQTPCSNRRRAPLIGEHNEEIYQKELGLSREKLISLREAGLL